MPLGGGVALGVGALGSAVIGGITAANQSAAATAAKQAALQQYLDLNVPDPAQQQLILQQYKQTGQLDPSIETAINQQSTAQNSIAVDPATRAAQMQALSQLSSITNAQGDDAQEKNQIQQGINQVNANEQGQTGAILQNAAARGVGGSGASLAAELEGAQAGANTASNNAMSAQAQASQRALSALSQQGALATTVHGQDYNQALNAANAEDAINRFNAQGANSAMAANTTAENQAQAYNVGTAQQVANQNVGVTNQEDLYNNQLIQQQYEDQLQKDTGEANAENGVASQANTNAANTGNMWGNISSGLAGAAGSVYKSGQTAGSTGTTNNYYSGSGDSGSSDSSDDDDDQQDGE